MTRALVIYDTKFGNTEKVANALVQGLAAQGIEAESVNVVRVAIDRLSEFNALLIGGPTHRQKNVRGDGHVPGPLRQSTREREGGVCL